MLGLLSALFVSSAAHASDFTMYYEVTTTKTGTYQYDYRMLQTGGSAGYGIGWLIIDDVSSSAGCGDGTNLSNAVLVGSAPGPWTALGSSSGGHNGRSFDYVLDEWEPAGVGDWIEWTVEADNYVDYADPFYWSNLVGDSHSCELIAQGDTDGDGVWEDFCKYATYGDDTDKDGIIDACDECPDDFADDSDGDGTCDAVDLCIGDDATGDSDKDGYCDSDDVCPGSDDAADSDADTVPDGCDVCVGDDYSGDVDADGFCSTDADGSEIDCDDSDPDTYPDAPELCDGIDNACVGVVSGAEADDDADGSLLCDGDCDDTNADSYPGAPELCDGLDNDCDGVAADEADADGDGLFACEGDCDDANSSISPNEIEVCDDALDNNCDGAVDEDCDGSGLDDTGTDGDKGGCSALGAASGGLWSLALGALMIGIRRRRA